MLNYTEDGNINIKTASAEDVPLILTLIRELSVYEKMEDQVVATEELLHESLFGSNATAEALIGYYAGEPAAFALYFRNFSTFLARPGLYLEDIYVKPEYRSKGVGRAIFHKLASIAQRRGYGRFEWSVLDWNEPAIRFYEKIGAREMKEWKIYRLAGEALKKAAGEQE